MNEPTHQTTTLTSFILLSSFFIIFPFFLFSSLLFLLVQTSNHSSNKKKKEEKTMGSPFPILDFMPVGFRFRPTDQELVEHYLKHKLLGDDDFSVCIIPELDLCKLEPWDIPAFSEIKSDEEWFFFSPRDYKYANSKRFNRATKCGFWKATGNDRNIKTRGTNNVVGTKKTLVFYQGRVPPGARTNWVIHEYHAITFDDSQRTFVLCRLMKKAEKKAEGGTVALNCDEGEPSSHMATEYENQATTEGIQDVGGTLPVFQTSHQAEKYFPPNQQSPVGIEQESSFPISPSVDAYFGNENSSMQTLFETTEEDEFLRSILADGDFVINEERRNAFVIGPTQSESLRRIHRESSDTDAEVVSALCGNILETSTMHDEHPRSGEYHASKTLKPSHGAVQGSTRLASFNHNANKEIKESTLRDDSWGAETSSCDSTTVKPAGINCVEISSSASALRRWRNQYHSKPNNLISQRAVARSSQTQREASSNSASNREAEKESPSVESEKDQKIAQNTSSRENLETRDHQSSNVNRKGSFIFLEIPSSSQSLFPRSVYLVNVVIGILLLIVISWEVL